MHIFFIMNRFQKDIKSGYYGILRQYISSDSSIKIVMDYIFYDDASIQKALIYLEDERWRNLQEELLK